MPDAVRPQIEIGPVAEQLLRDADAHAWQYSRTGEHVAAAAVAELAELLTADHVVATPAPGPGWTVTVHWVYAGVEPGQTDHVLLGWNHRNEPVFLDDDPLVPSVLEDSAFANGSRIVSVNAPESTR